MDSEVQGHTLTRTAELCPLFNLKPHGLERYAVDKNTAALRRTRFDSQHLCGDSKPCVTPVPGDPTPSSSL